MSKSAVVIAASAEARRSIDQLIRPTKLFSQIHFCGSLQEVRFLLDNSPIDMLFCDACSSLSGVLHFTVELISLASDYGSEMVFCSHLSPQELPRLGVVPFDSNCLSYDSSLSAVMALLKRLLNSSDPEQEKHSADDDRLIDQSSGIYNRFYFDAFLDQEICRSKLTGRPFALLLIEPNAEQQQEKNSNPTGWLPSIAATIKSQIRTSDLLCRVENRRLALLLPETSSNNARRVKQRIELQAEVQEKEFPLQLRVGMAAPSPANHFNRHGLLREAESSFASPEWPPS